MLRNIGFKILMCIGVWIALSGSVLGATTNPLDTKLAKMDLKQAATYEIVSALSDLAHAPVCLEERYIDPAPARGTKYDLHTNALSLRDVLNQTIRVVDTHAWIRSQNPFAINLIPVKYASDTSWPPNRTCPKLVLKNVSLSEAVKAVSYAVYPQGGHEIHLAVAYGGVLPYGKNREEHWLVKFYEKRITMTIEPGTVRGAFNQIAAMLGDARWTYGEYEYPDKSMHGVISFYPITPNLYPVETSTR